MLLVVRPNVVPHLSGVHVDATVLTTEMLVPEVNLQLRFGFELIPTLIASKLWTNYMVFP